MHIAKILMISTALVGAATAAQAQPDGYYVSLSGGASFLDNSVNEGAFDGDFVSGAGTMIPAGTTLPSGTPVGWTTEFDTGFTISGAAGVRFWDNWRSELEVAYQDVGVGTHNGVSAADIPLGGEDAGVLITGSDNLGADVATIVADGQGDVSTVFVFANLYYDIDLGGPVTPYVGIGIGGAFANVEFVPSGVGIIDDSASAVAGQIMAGLSVEVSPQIEAFAGYRYRAASDLGVDVSLFNATLDVENEGSVAEAGLRFNF
ncbi:MAG: P44/Msp2 family outer membrane protein [Pseudomonadota bacterium]